MERDPKEDLFAGLEYTTPAVGETSAAPPSYDMAVGYGYGMEDLSQAKETGVTTVQAVEEDVSQLRLEFTDSHVSSYAQVSGRIGSEVAVPSVEPEDVHGGLLPRGVASSSAEISNQSAPNTSTGYGGSGNPGMSSDEARKLWFWNPRRYQQFFDVDTNDVLKRMVDSLKGPMMPQFLENTRDNPDLYGPFWVATTVTFISAVTGNLNTYINQAKSQELSTDAGYNWYFDIDKVSYSAILFYGYVGLIGFLLWAIMAYYKSTLGLANLWCIYGYSLTVFLPVAPLCTVPLSWLKWLLVMGATIISGLFLLTNLKADVKEVMGASSYIVLLAVFGLHFGLGLSLKLFFFQY